MRCSVAAGLLGSGAAAVCERDQRDESAEKRQYCDHQ